MNINKIIVLYSVFIFLYFFIINLYYFIFLILSSVKLLKTSRLKDLDIIDDFSARGFPSVTIIIPAYNEEETIIKSLVSIFKIDYEQMEIIIVNDGSKDRTLDVLIDHLQLKQEKVLSDPRVECKPIIETYRSQVKSNVLVIDKENGGKSDALNAGLNYTHSDLFCSIDADSLIDKDGVKKLVNAYMKRKNKIVALGGIVRVSNGCDIVNGSVKSIKMPKSFLARLQTMEYIRAFLCGRAGLSQFNGLLILSGAYAIFDTKSVKSTGGYDTNTIGEDMELVIRMHKYMTEKNKNYSVEFIPDPVCWTEVPESLKILKRQRKRWQKGLIQTMLKHRQILLNPAYGLNGLISYPYFFFFEMLGPLVELSGYIIFTITFALGIINYDFMAMFILLAIVFGTCISLFSLLLEEFTVRRYTRLIDIFWLIFLAIAENLGYRQLNSWWRLIGWYEYLKGDFAWGEMERKKHH